MLSCWLPDLCGMCCLVWAEREYHDACGPDLLPVVTRQFPFSC